MITFGHVLSEKNNTVKQADTIMLTYPLNWNMSREIMLNDLEYYELLTTPRTPAMTWSFFTVGWKWVNDNAKASAYFFKSYKDYLIQPFKVGGLQVVFTLSNHFVLYSPFYRSYFFYFWHFLIVNLG